jgi:hypothetical protein
MAIAAKGLGTMTTPPDQPSGGSLPPVRLPAMSEPAGPKPGAASKKAIPR